MGSGPGRIGSLNLLRARRLAALLVGSQTELADDLSTNTIAAVTGPAGDGFVLLAEDGAKAFGSSLIWAHRTGVAGLTLMVDPAADPGVQARRAKALADPPRVLAVDGANLDPVGSPGPPQRDALPDEIDTGVEAMLDAGLDVVDIGGVAIGEYLGLEVARAVVVDGVCEVHVGIGAFDREANRVLHPGRNAADSLRVTIDEVARYRRPGSVNHPLSTLDRERWLLKLVVDEPSLVGLSKLERVPAVRARSGLRESMPVAALGESDGTSVMVAVGSGTDPAMLADLADMIECHRPDRLVFVPIASLVPILADVLNSLRVPATVVEVARPWG